MTAPTPLAAPAKREPVTVTHANAPSPQACASAVERVTRKGAAEEVEG